jgi:hypothetical protein
MKIIETLPYQTSAKSVEGFMGYMENSNYGTCKHSLL